MPDTNDDAPSRKTRYEQVLRTIASQTSPKQAPGIRPATIATHLAGPYGRYDREEIDSTLKAARQNDDIVRWLDVDGQTRVTLAVVDDLQRVVAYMNAHEYPAERIERVAAWIQEVRDGD